MTPSPTTGRSPSRNPRGDAGRAGAAAGERLWDVGAGSGSISVEWCLGGNGCRATAFERDAQRRHNLAANAAAFGAAIDVRGDAPDAFDDAEPPSAIFIGGGLTRPGLLDACFDHLPSGGRLVANVVTTESEAVVIKPIRGSVGSCDASSTITARRWAPSPAGTRSSRSPSGR